MREIAIKLRKQGVPLRRIAELCGVALNTVQRWTQGIALELPERSCEYEPCGKTFRPSRADQRFCCQGCKGQNRHLKRQSRNVLRLNGG